MDKNNSIIAAVITSVATSATMFIFFGSTISVETKSENEQKDDVITEQEANGFEANQNNVSSIANPYQYTDSKLLWLKGWMRAEKLKQQK